MPELWKHRFPKPDANSHKYTRGHSLIIGGGLSSTGAARLAAYGALRIGSGLVSVACTDEALPIYAASLTSVMIKAANNTRELDMLLGDERVNAVLIGPGGGVTKHTKKQTLQILSYKKCCVIDADALTVFASHPEKLFDAIQGPTVLTPHEGEFARLFSCEGEKTDRAVKAAEASNAVIVLKGNETVIASPEGHVVVNSNASPWLATAGSGDVLAGMITGLMAQGMLAFDAACAAVWMHGRAGALFGPGLISEDLPALIPAVLKEIL